MALVHIPQGPGYRHPGSYRPGLTMDLYNNLRIPGITHRKLSAASIDDIRDKNIPISVRILGNNGVGKLTFAEEMLNIEARDPTYMEAVSIAGYDTANYGPSSKLVHREYGHGDRIFAVLESWHDVRLRSLSRYAKKGHATIKKNVRATYFGMENQVYIVLPTWTTVDKSENQGYKDNVIILIVDATKPELDEESLFRVEHFLRKSLVSRIIIAVNKMDLVAIDNDHTDGSATEHQSSSASANADISYDNADMSTSANESSSPSPRRARFVTRRHITPNEYWRDSHPMFGPESRFKQAVETVSGQIRKIESKLKSYDAKPLELFSVPTVAKNGGNINHGVFSQLCPWYQRSTVMEILARKGD
ncbi:hypothetical protein V1525DRAFT_394640 [Lipomyces kononenkoae]|uniref:Uncharacterized protein n=1 Tax=Lipomyces kononenkoae TaxID=34357 RepID=A0ACC3TA96_LIPKO